LEKAGFEIGDTIQITVQDNALNIAIIQKPPTPDVHSTGAPAEGQAQAWRTFCRQRPQ
jgi:hypothetical protein